MLKNKYKFLINHSAAKYLLVGAAAFSFDYVVLLVSYYAVGLSLKVSTSLGFFTGFLISFVFNRQWVFAGKQRKNTVRQVVEYLVLLAFNYLFTLWGVSFLNAHGIKPFIGKLMVMFLVMCWNYALFRWVIFVGDNKDIAEAII